MSTNFDMKAAVRAILALKPMSARAAMALIERSLQMLRAANVFDPRPRAVARRNKIGEQFEWARDRDFICDPLSEQAAESLRRAVILGPLLAYDRAVTVGEVVGFDWKQGLMAFGIPTDEAPDPGRAFGFSGSGYSYGKPQPQNPYWAQRRAQQSPLATASSDRLRAALALQQTLRQQQTANLTALQRQLATPIVAWPLSAPPLPSATGTAPGPADDSSPAGDEGW